VDDKRAKWAAWTAVGLEALAQAMLFMDLVSAIHG